MNDSSIDIDTRIVAARFLQEMNLDVDIFFTYNKLINPNKLRWGYPHGSTKWANKSFTPGFIYDIYNADLVYDSRTGCGGGFSEIFITLKRLLEKK
jgi:hypothetical protein